MKLERVTLLINRAAALQIEKTVPSWEVRVINTIFGAPNVTVLRTEAYDGVFDPEEAFAEMVRRYGTAQDTEGEKLVFKAYPDVYALESSFERSIDRATKRKPAEDRAAA